MATFVNDLRLTELATGEGSGSWGVTTNTNLSLIGESFSFGTEAITTNADTHTTTIADGSTDPGRSLFLKYTGTLDSNCTITIGPNTVSKLWFIENATSGGFSIIISQGSGANITIPNGQTKAIYSDGAGSGGAMVDAFQDLSIPDLFVDDDLTVGDDLILSSDSAIIKFGADADTTLTHTDGSGLTLNSTNKIMFNDASQFIQGSSATVLSLGATDEIDLTATAIDVNGTIDVSGNATLGGTLGVTGAVTADAGISIDNITIDGTEIDLSSGDLTIDVAGDIILDANGADVLLKDDGTTFGEFTNSSTDFVIKSSTSDKDMLFKGNDGGSEITALTLDMSAAGAATFNDKITAVGTSVFTNLDISGDIDVDGTTNLDVVDIDGAVDMASTLSVGDLTTLKTDGSGFALKIVENSGSEHYQIGTDSFGGLVFYNETTKVLALNDAGGIDTFGNVIFNEDSADLDFRVESNSNSHMLFVDGGNDTVGINMSSPSSGAALQVRTSADKTIMFSDSISETGNVITLQGVNDAGTSMVGIGLAASSIVLERGPVTINDNSGDHDFRVESDSNTHMLFVDAGNNAVGIGVSDPAGLPLHLKVGSGDNKLRMETSSKDAFVMELKDSSGDLHLGTNTTAGALVIADGGNVGVGVTDVADAKLVVQSTGVDGTYANVLSAQFSSNSNEHNVIATSVSSAAAGSGFLFKASDGGGSTGTTEVLKLTRAGATFNDASGDQDFRVESDGNANMFGINAGSDFVYIGADEQVQNGTLSMSAVSASPVLGMMSRSTGSGDQATILLQQTNATSGNFTATGDGRGLGLIGFRGVDSAGVAREGGGIRVEQSGAAVSGAINGQMTFRTRDVDRMLITSAGDICINSTNSSGSSGATAKLFVKVPLSVTSNAFMCQPDTNGTTNAAIFQNSSGANAGFIQYTATTTTYATSSDYRMKENVVALSGATDRLKQLNPSRFNFIEDANTTVDGFLAHEVQAVVPEAVTGTKDAVDEDGNPDYQGIDQSKLVPLLVATIQELEARIAALESK